MRMIKPEDRLEARLRELHRYQILDSGPEPEFNGFCELACALARTPISIITFHDRTRVWAKACVGDAFQEIPIDQSITIRAVERGETLVCGDLAASPEFADHPLVTGGKRFRALVSIPITVRRGVTIGALTVFDTVARGFSDTEVANLTRLHQAVVDRLHLRLARIERQIDHRSQARKNAEIAAQKHEIGKQRRLLEQTSRLARIGGWEYDVDTNRVSWSEEVYRILELDPDSFDLSKTSWTKFCGEEVREQLQSLLTRARDVGEAFELEIPLVTLAGRRRWARCLCDAEMRRGRVIRLVGTLQDITVQRATEEEVTFIATHDMVTGLINRSVFQERLDRALYIGRPHAVRAGLFLIDIDHFKEVNDTLGHHAGDVLLGEVGRRLTRALDGSGLVARLGGDEFAIIVTDYVSEDTPTTIAEAIRQELIEPIAYEDEAIPVTLSIGFAAAPPGSPADQLLKDADIALYEAKGSGRNRFVVFDRSMRDEIELRLSIVRAIRHAVEVNELVLYYQPKVSLRSGAHAGFEALLRWRRPDGFVATPSFFGATLDDPQLGQVIGDLVVRQAVAQAARWNALGLEYDHIAINVSSTQFRRGDFVPMLKRLLAEFSVRPTSLMVEVTENVLLSKESDNVQPTLVDLACMGIKIALDDFGTGYASLTHLKEFPVDLLKIDRSFVATLTDQRESRSIVRGMTALAHDLGIAVIAEGIETTSQRDMLRHFGTDIGQGYLFARPMPSEQVESIYLSGRGAVAKA
jgi:diguanylate cyclase (GGDEF)-like protein